MIWLRCKLGLQIGTGHAVRCLSLAHAIQDEGRKAGLIVDEDATAFIARIEDEGFGLHILRPGQPLSSEIDQYPEGPVLLDLSNPVLLEQLSDLVAGLQARGRKVALIEGLDKEAYTGSAKPDLVITPYLGAEAETARPARKWIGGARYAVLAPEYDHPPSARDGRSGILVMLSGSDPWHLTEKVMSALSSRGNDLTFVIGGSIPHNRALTLSAASEAIGASVLEAPKGLFQHFNASRAAILGPGLAKYEAVATRTPAVIVCPDEKYAAQQTAFIDAGLGALVTASDEDFQARLAEAIEHALQHVPPEKRVIDGQGARRVARELISTFGQ